MIFDYYLLADFDKAGQLPLLPAPVWPDDALGAPSCPTPQITLPTPPAVAALDGRFSRVWVVDGGWAPLRRYLARSRALLAALGRAYRFVGEKHFTGVKVLLFSNSGPPTARHGDWSVHRRLSAYGSDPEVHVPDSLDLLHRRDGDDVAAARRGDVDAVAVPARTVWPEALVR